MQPDVEFLRDLRADFERLVERGASRSTASRAARAFRGRRRAAAVAILAATALLVAIAGLQRSRHSAPPARAQQPGIATPSLLPRWSLAHPLWDARVVTLASAERRMGGKLILPGRGAVRPPGIAAVYAKPDEPPHHRWAIAAVVYRRARIVVEYQTPVPYPDPGANYRGYASESPGIARVTHIAGHVALLIAGRAGAGVRPRAPRSVELVAHGVRVLVIGYRPIETLVDVAASVARR